ncbi:hypothetical protein Syun_022847 [Stephania yunnanensis]|uniref:IMP dehydrogenase/GMP reductase domain-containing protein n=1 Tax=Stephania yunnanensis TaxID=152371 RepID=A0AAP0F7U4_9MAGN
MDTVSESSMAVSMAALGGIAIVYYNNTPSEQYSIIRSAKSRRIPFASDPIFKSLSDFIDSGYDFASSPSVFVTRNRDSKSELLGLVSSFDVVLSLELHDVPNPLIQAKIDKGLNDIANCLMVIRAIGYYSQCHFLCLFDPELSSEIHYLLISLDHIEVRGYLSANKGQFLGEFLWFCCLWEILIENGIREAVKLSTVHQKDDVDPLASFYVDRSNAQAGGHAGVQTENVLSPSSNDQGGRHSEDQNALLMVMVESAVSEARGA